MTDRASKIRTTISSPLAVYVRDLLDTGLYGINEGDVIRTLVGAGINRAIMDKMIVRRVFENGKLRP